MSTTTKDYTLTMPLEEAMRTQRALRRLKPDPVDDDLLLHLVELALKAPVGSNAQKWEFVIVKDRDKVAAIGELNRTVADVYTRLGKGRKSARRIVESVRWQMEHFGEIPVVIVACYRGVAPPLPFVAATSFFGSIYPSIQNLLLAARAAGLGAALITLPLWSPAKVRKLLGLPWDVVPCAMIPIGWPVDSYGPTKRKPVGDVVHVDTFGNQPWRVSPPPAQAPNPVRISLGAGAAVVAGGALLAWLLMRD
ncbi:MAG TPA: nitroreductase family protein [Candidatus Xenobia bacterium]|jgi:nitroreductase